MIFNTAKKLKKVDINLKSSKVEPLKDKNRNNNELGLKGVVSLFHVVDNILECILFVLICTQYMLSSSSYVLYVPEYILSVLS